MSDIKYPPEYIFPRNPNLAHWLKPQNIEEKYLDDGSGLRFEFGYTGTLNTIRTVYPPYLDKSQFDYKNRKWVGDPQIVLLVKDNRNVKDITPYFSSSVINFSTTSTGVYDKLEYYFDGEKIVTNYDFTSVENRKKVTVMYSKLLNSIRVKAVMKTNVPGISYYTPVIDQYTLLLDKQRVLS